jgi:acetylornithine deacetylase/succinyl-diaminopimelate desuccinylase-like protein
MSLAERVIGLAVEIQQIAAPTFAEGKRSLFIQERFEQESLSDVETDALGNVYGRVPGDGKKPPIIVTAHIDTVFPAGTDLSIRYEEDTIHGPGIGDNSLGTAGLFGLLWRLKEEGPALPGDLWLAANVCEEGLGDLRGIRAVVDRFEDEALAYIILEGMALGQVYHRGLGVQRYRITAKGSGGHSWVDYGKPSAIHDLAAIVTRITALELPKEPRTTLNVGMISGGTSVNTIAAEASLQLDLRSSGCEALEALIQQVESLISGSSRPDMAFTAKVIGKRPAGEIPETHPLVRLAATILKSHGIRPTLAIGSTDANIPLSRGLPAICIGLTQGGGTHTVEEYIRTRPLETGLAQLYDLVCQAFFSFG